jgi:predicted CXXCH cytochrome family protein
MVRADGGKLAWVIAAATLATTLLAMARLGKSGETGETSLPQPAVASAPPDKPKTRILYPADKTVIVSRNVQVIARMEDGPLLVDGKPQSWDRYAPPVRTVRLHLDPGRHTFELAGAKLEVFLTELRDNPEAPHDWPVLRRHPRNEDDDDRCAACHQTGRTVGQSRVGDLKTYRACFECHRREEFDSIHCHPLEPLEHCNRCHALHGSVRPSLLKAPEEQLCGECHKEDEKKTLKK